VGLALTLVGIAVVVVVLRGFGPLLLRWGAFLFVGAVVARVAGLPLGASSSSTFAELLVAAVMWTTGSVWYARRHGGWPGRLSAATLGRVRGLDRWVGGDVGRFTWVDRLFYPLGVLGDFLRGRDR
jgi:hypothetical protein